MRRPGRLWRGFGCDRRGILPVEMALCAPVLVLLLVGTADVVWLYLAQERLQRAAAVIADLTARTPEIRPADLDDVFRAAREVVVPLDLATDGRAFVSSVADMDGLGPFIVWQRAMPPGLAVASRIGTVGSRADFGDSFTLARGETVVVGEAFLEVRPLFGLIVAEPQRLYVRALHRPRYGSVTLRLD
ncbi:MAG: TadE/TadG family type IV pilus assembly protein [Geminicoccaceae bacterium]